MKYKRIKEAEFISRPNRFIAKVLVDGNEETVHVKNTGRCKELLVPGCLVYLEESDNPARKTKYDLVTVEKAVGEEVLLINMDSQMPNAVAEEWIGKSGIFAPDATVRREVKFGNSRIDIYVEDGERRAFVEVKGVTLEEYGVAMFPDAPTERGVKHLGELASAVKMGYEAYVLFIVQMKGVRLFKPNFRTHPEFASALKSARDAGVSVLAIDCVVTPDSVVADRYVTVEL